MANVKYKPLRIRITDAGKSAINAAAARIIEEMNKAGISGDGTPFPPGKTREITMHQSGRMHRDFEAYTTRLQYKAPQAARWQELYNWCGIPEIGPWRDKYNAEVQRILDGGDAITQD